MGSVVESIGKAVGRALGETGKSIAKAAAIPVGTAVGIATGNPLIGAAVAGGIRSLGGGEATLKNAAISAGVAGLGTWGVGKVGGLAGSLAGSSSGGLGTLGKIGLGLGAASALSGKGLGETLTGSQPSVEQLTPPGADKAFSILDNLASTYNLSSIQSIINSTFPTQTLQNLADEISNLDNIDRYGYKALNQSLMADTMGGFSEALQNVRDIDQIVNNKLNQTNTALALGGLINTPALQRTQADIISNLNFEKADRLGSLLSQRANTLSGLMKTPYAIDSAEISNIGARLGAITDIHRFGIEQALLPFDIQLKLAQAYTGIPVDTIVKPGQPGLLQTIAPALTTWALNKWL